MPSWCFYSWSLSYFGKKSSDNQELWSSPPLKRKGFSTGPHIVFTVCGDKSYKKGEQNQEICRYRATSIIKVIRIKNIIVWSVMDKISWKPAVYNRGRKNVCGLSKVLGTKKLQSPNIQTVKIALLDTQKRRKRARSPMRWLYYYNCPPKC